MKFTMCSVDHAICVSNTCRENLVVRATLPPEKISTIPNAIDPSKFTPDPSARVPKGTINVVIMSRLVYRKGIDLVAPVVKVYTIKISWISYIWLKKGVYSVVLLYLCFHFFRAPWNVRVVTVCICVNAAEEL